MNIQIANKLFYIFFVLFMSFSLSGCGDSAIDLVKKGRLEIDRSTTIQNALENYSYFTKYEWRSFETQQKRTIVEFNGELIDALKVTDLCSEYLKTTTHYKVTGDISESQHVYGKSGVLGNNNSMVTYIELFTAAKPKLKVVIQFTILDDNKFNISYFGFTYTTINGVHKEIKSTLLVDIKNIYSNNLDIKGALWLYEYISAKALGLDASGLSGLDLYLR